MVATRKGVETDDRKIRGDLEPEGLGQLHANDCGVVGIAHHGTRTPRLREPVAKMLDRKSTRLNSSHT